MYRIWKIGFIWLLVANFGVSSSLEATTHSISARQQSITPRNIIYVQSLLQPSSSNVTNVTHTSLLSLIENETKVTHVIIAALALSKTNTSDITLNGVSVYSFAYDWLWNETQILQADGVKVSLMLGGAGSVAFSLLQQNFYGYYPPLLSLLQYTGVDGIDLDIELRVPSSVSLQTVLNLLNSIERDMGSSFIITMAPVATDFTTGHGLEGRAWNYSTLDAAATSDTKPSGKVVDWYNVQFYDGYGNAGNITDYNTIIANGWDPSRIVLGLAAYNLKGWYPLESYEAVVQDLAALYPNFGGVDGWEYGVAGTSDSAYVKPWQWVAGIGEALFGCRVNCG